MYRSLAWLAAQRGVSWENAGGLAALVGEDALQIVSSNQGTRIFAAEQDITPELHTSAMGEGASQVAQHPEVRQQMVAWQQRFAASQDAVLDGRDIGTQVLPQATLKLYLSASARVRATRRYQELQENGRLFGLTLEEIEADITLRDQRDMNREVGPLKQAEDAIFIDTSELTIEEVIDLVRGLLKGKER